MNTTMWLDLLDEGIPLLLLIALGIALYQGLKKNHALLAEREDLLKRYLIFRGNKQIRLKMLKEEEKSHQELLKNISTSWKHFKRTYDQYLTSFHQNTAQTKLTLQIITVGLLINSLRGVIGDYLLTHSKIYLLFNIVKELSSYVLVILSFLLLRLQAHRLRLSKWKVAEMDREILFFPNNLSEADSEGLYNEFDPLEVMKAEDGKKDQDHHGGAEG
jgi:hypothetical protein